MITHVLMPQLGLEVTEGTVVEIAASVGSPIAKDDPILVLSTDKADVDIGATVAGWVRAIEVEVGDTVEIGARLALISDTADEPLDADVASDADLASAGAPAAQAAPAGNGAVPGRMTTAAPPRVRAAPVARRAAAAHGIELTSLTGTGPRGRITMRDVQAALGDGQARSATAPSAAPPATAPLEAGLEPLSPMRRMIARRMTASQRDIPQFQLVREIDVTHLMAQKTAAAAAATSGGRPGVGDLLLQAIAEVLVRHPDLAAAYVDGPQPALRRPDSVDVGLAVATDGGLVVPVIRGAHERTLREIAADRERLVAAARAGTLGLTEMTGGATTLSNLGSFGVDRFTAMVNPGESSIFAVGRVAERLVPRGRGTAVVPVLTVTLSLDHRVIDGAAGSRALAEFADLLEGAMPWRI